ncbi:MAG: transposase [Pseudomonadota bacterium]
MDDRLKLFRTWDALDGRREIFCPEDSLPEDDLVFFLLELIPGLDLSAFHEFYSKDLRGQPPFSIALMTTLLVYSYSVGVFSSRKIAGACDRNLAFLAIVGNDRPDFRTISDFRKNQQAAMKPLFLAVLRMAGELGMVRLGNLATDGTKIEANASRHKAMSYGYMTRDLERLQAEIDKLLESANRTDEEQDAALGSRRGDELPDELKRREDRIEKIQAAKARLEAEAQARAAAEQRERDAATAKRAAEGKSRRGKQPAPIDPTPEAKAQTNFTDPDAKIMKRSNKGFDYCYNAQAVVDSAQQIIVAAEATAAANDKQQAVPLAQAAVENLAAAGIEWPRDAQDQPRPIPNTADSGYFSEANVRDVTALGLEPYYATGRQKHHAPDEAAPATAEIATTDNAKEAMARKLRTESGRLLYAARKHIVEPVFGQIKRVRGFRKFLLRSLELVSAEWQLICLTHNLLKIWRFTTSLR